MNPLTIFSQSAFAAAAAFVGYTYGGYPLWLWARSRLKPRPVRRLRIQPSVTIILPIHNEERWIAEKCEDLQRQNYPEDLLHIVIVSDGSTDHSAALATKLGNHRVQFIEYSRHRGKAWAINVGAQASTEEILLLCDARQKFAPCAVRCLVENFADPEVGAVTGKMVLCQHSNQFGQAIGRYWEYEKWVRQRESEIDSVCGVTGCIWAVRRRLFRPLPEGTILDDVYLPMEVIRQGYRVVFDPRAIAYDRPSESSEIEYTRKRRTLLGNFELLGLSHWILTAENRIRFQFLSHKVFRLLAPLAFLIMLFSSWLQRGFVFHVLFLAQVTFYLLGMFDRWIPSRTWLRSVSSLASFFLVVHRGALVGFIRWSLRRKGVWVRAHEYPQAPM
jgi:cellulose synthase/poly-beta-1,6-N-acetylglucosamine synthase-like glycosyltransferase